MHRLTEKIRKITGDTLTCPGCSLPLPAQPELEAGALLDQERWHCRFCGRSWSAQQLQEAREHNGA